MVTIPRTLPIERAAEVASILVDTAQERTDAMLVLLDKHPLSLRVQAVDVQAIAARAQRQARFMRANLACAFGLGAQSAFFRSSLDSVAATFAEVTWLCIAALAASEGANVTLSRVTSLPVGDGAEQMHRTAEWLAGLAVDYFSEAKEAA